MSGDVWKSRAQVYYFGITAVWIAPDPTLDDWRMMVACLSLKRLESHQAVPLTDAILNVQREYHVKLFALASDNENTMLAVGRNLKGVLGSHHARCMAHVLDLGVRVICLQPWFKAALSWLDRVVEWWRVNHMYLKSDGRPPLAPAYSATRWGVRWEQLNWFSKIKNAQYLEIVLGPQVKDYMDPLRARKHPPPDYSDAVDEGIVWALHQLFCLLYPLYELTKLVRTESHPVSEV